jgi:ArsR family transcriptional regulator, lead/cadmium/zinc/bismuth-responsive transcriptional repressor
MRSSESMTSTELNQRSRQNHRVRSARETLLSSRAASLLEPVRDVMCEPTRTQIVRALGPGPLSVTDLASILNRSKSATSQHLRVLRAHGVVSPRRRGRSVFYSLTQNPLIEATVHVLDTAATMSAA